MEITAELLNQFFQLLSVIILALIAWWNKQRTDSAAITAAATTSTAATNTAIAATEKAAVAQIAATTPAAAPIVVQTVPQAKIDASSASTIGDGDPNIKYVTNPLLLGPYPIVQIGAITYHPVYKMHDELRKVLAGGLSPEDQTKVTQQITAAEETRGGLGSPHYVIAYSKGFYEINYTVRNTGDGHVYYVADTIASGHDR